jgi:hypothetical protein
LAYHLHIGAIAAAMAERGKSDPRLRSDLAEGAPNGLPRDRELAAACAVDNAPHRGGAVEDDDHRRRLIAPCGRRPEGGEQRG